MSKDTDTKSTTCDVWGTAVHVVNRWQHQRKNLCIEITENYKSGRCTIDKNLLLNNEPTINEKRLKELWKADLVLENKRFLKWHGDKRNETIDVFNYSTSSKVDAKLIRTDKELKKIGQDILKFNFPQNLLDELNFDLKEMYLIFGTYKGEVL